jgi:CheY-like chemotaxis protein
VTLVPATVLIIDDAIHIRRLAARMLERVGYETLEADDGLQGLRLLREKKPDIVTCDLSMPFMNGHEFLAAAKSDETTRDIPIIIVTAIGQEGEAAKATSMGADAYLTKPFSSSNLIETIQTHLGKRSLK